MPRSRKPQAIPDRLVAAGRAMQTWHLGRRPTIVVEVEPGKPTILAFAEGRDRHPPTGRQLLPIEGLAGKEREAILRTGAAIATRHPVVNSCRLRAWLEKSERQSFSGTSRCPLRHRAVDGPDAIELRGLVELFGVALGETLLDVVDAGRLQQQQDAAAEATAHHARADHLGGPGGELHQQVKLPAAYREIESKALVRCIEQWPQASRRAPAKRVGRLQHARILADHVSGAVSLDGVIDAHQIV